MQINIHRSALVAVFLAGAFATTAAAATQTVTVNGVRPVADALLLVESAYLVPINYEDIRYVPQTDLTERTIMKNWSVALRDDVTRQSPPETAKAAVRQAMGDILSRYQNARGVALFTVTERDGAFEVIPVQAPNEEGQMEKIQPLLDTPVTITPQQRSAAELVEAVAKAISAATGRVVNAGTLPSPLFMQRQTTIGADNESARSVLMRLFKEIPVGYESEPNKDGGTRDVPSALSWRVLCSSGRGTFPGVCAINVHVVAPTGRATVGMEKVQADQ